MYFLYNLILPIIAGLCSPIILIAFFVQPKFRAGFLKKLGAYSLYGISEEKQKNENSIVFHAVSVGEVNAIETLVKKYRVVHPDSTIILTTTTKTGQEVAHKKLEKIVDKITYFPYDFSFSVNSFFNTYNPKNIVIAETEIWPCFVHNAHKKSINVYIANGRISPNSYKGYRKFRFLFKNILSNYAQLLMQSPSDAQRIIDIGADSSKVKVMGNLKYDIHPTLSAAEVTRLAYGLNLSGQRIFVAASTHSGEDEIAISAFIKAKEKYQDLKLLIAPRHPQRYAQVEELLKNTNLKYGKRSEDAKFSDCDIIMLDTMGELSNFFSLAHLAFIGGSFSKTGGHNPLEANIWGKPVISGPNVFNFKDVYKLLINMGAAKIVYTQKELADELVSMLENRDKYLTACNAASNIFDTNRGAVDFVINEVK
ncbi:MAG: 3-deoxy-D-manno-octulosonic acid transferase [Candidatus Gastranaerophilales bacterium]|nr:3-deoxy-D-manno-octulosonic acid transferase [Candidatus Gastranaerophilales bacterium]